MLCCRLVQPRWPQDGHDALKRGAVRAAAGQDARPGRRGRAICCSRRASRADARPRPCPRPPPATPRPARSLLPPRAHSEASPSDFAQPIKRTRSEQGLAGILADAQQAEAQALLAQQQQQQQHTQRGRADLLKHFTAAPPAASPSGTDSESDRGASPPCAVATGAPQQGAGGLALGAGRGSWMSSLAPVLSDMGSSTNSLVSLESDMTRSSASHPALQLLAPPGGAGACAGAAGTPRQLGRPATPPQPVPRAGSAAAVSYLQAAGSAASLQHGNLGGTTGFSSGGRSAPWPQYVTGSLLYRTQSDLSDAATCSAASGGRFAPPPPPAHSPPPLIPAGPVRASSFLLEGSAAPPELRRLRTAAAAPAGPAVTAVAAAPEAPLQQLPAALGGAAAAFGAGTRAPVFATAAAAFCDAGGAAAAGWAQGLAGGARARGGLAALRAQAPITPGLCSVASLPSFPSAAPAAPAGLASGEAEADGWDFGRRARQQRLARTGSSGCVPGAGGRRRSSIEASMPWRARVDGAIAAAAVSEARLPPEPEEGPPQPEPEPAAGALPWEQQGRGLWQEEGDEGDEEEGGEGDAEAQWRQWRERQPGAGGARPSPGSASGSAAGSRGRSSTDSESDGGGRRASGGSSDAGRSGCSPAVGAGASQRLGKVRRGGAGASAYASSYYARENSGGAAFELFLRLNRARQTLGARGAGGRERRGRRSARGNLPAAPCHCAPRSSLTRRLCRPLSAQPRPTDFAKRQAQQFAELEVAEMTVWEALDALAELREFEAGLAPASEGLDPSFSLRDHAFQVRGASARVHILVLVDVRGTRACASVRAEAGARLRARQPLAPHKHANTHPRRRHTHSQHSAGGGALPAGISG